MLLVSWLKSLRTRQIPAKKTSLRNSILSVSPAAERLEDRTLLAAFTVNDSTDKVDLTDLGDGIVDTDENTVGNQVTLRAAIQEANNLPGADTITLGPGTFTLTRAGQRVGEDGRREDLAFTGDLDIRDNLTIQGAGQGVTIIDADSLDRVLHVFPGVTVNLIDIGLTGGDSFRNHGGGIYSDGGNVNLTRVSVLDNRGQHGAGLYANGGSVTTNETLFNGNIAQMSGGGIYNSGGTLTVSQNSRFTNNFVGVDGGGIYNMGTLSITDSFVAINEAFDDAGGIYHAGGNFNLTSSTITNNSARDEAGGLLFAVGTGTITSSNISDNEADSGGGGIVNMATLTITNSNLTLNSARDGGGIDNDGGSLSLTNSTIARNSSLADGAGIYNVANGRFTIDHSTISDNTAGDEGGGIFSVSNVASSINTSTISGNTARLGGGITNFGALTLFASTVAQNKAVGTTSNAGGISNKGGTLSVRNTIIARNTAVGASQDIAGFFTSQGNNLVGNATGAAGFVTGTKGDLAGTNGAPINPLLGTLALNGGTTESHALLAGSPAIDAGSNSGAPTTDQRGLTRIVDGDLNGTATVDIGSFELISPPVLTAPIGATSDSTPTIRWTSLPNTSRYELWIRNVTTGQDPVIREANLKTTSFTPATPLADGEYRVWVRGYDATGAPGVWSLPISFTVQDNRPGQPVISGPKGIIKDSTPTFSWNTVVGTFRYELWVNNLTTGQERVIRESDIFETNFTPTKSLANGNYRFWVRSRSKDGVTGEWSVPADFTVNVSGLGQPAMIAPTGTTADPTPTFTWTEVGGATQYDLWVDSRTTGQSQVIRRQNIADTSFTSVSSLNNGNYRSWVRAVTDNGQVSEWSAPLDFTINSAPIARPTLTAPSGTVGDSTPTIMWDAVAGADHYDLWVDNRTTGTEQVIRLRNLITNSYTPINPLTEGTYQVWVRAVTPGGLATDWSAPRQFTVDVTPGKPRFLSPTGDVTNTIPTLTWTAAENAVTYDLWVNNLTSSQEQVIRQPSLTSTSFTVLAPLPDGKYRAWVRAINSEGKPGPWSAQREFVIVDPDPDRFEANNDIQDLATATDLMTGSQRQDDLTIHDSTDADVFVWEATVAGRLTVDILFEHAKGDLELGVYGVFDNPNGTDFIDRFLGSSNTVTDNESVFASVQPGDKVAILVFGFNGAISPDYDLVITETPAPAVTVDNLATSDLTPQLTGTVDDPDAQIVVTVDTQIVAAVNNGDGTWTLADNTLFPLFEGLYDVQVSAISPDGVLGRDLTVGELLIDATAPTVTIDPLITNDIRPPLTGQVGVRQFDGTLAPDPDAVVTVMVGGQSHIAVNNGDGTWMLRDNTLSPLIQGVYNVTVTGVDLAGNVGTDTTIDELTIDTTAPVVTVNLLTTTNRQPELRGTVNDPNAMVTLTVNGVTYPSSLVSVFSNNTWVLPANTITPPLGIGTFSVTAMAVDLAGNGSTDNSVDELTIIPPPPPAFTSRFGLLDSAFTDREEIFGGLN